MRRRILASVGVKPLPYLREVAYLESDGNQYVKLLDKGTSAQFNIKADFTILQLYDGSFKYFLAGGFDSCLGWYGGKIRYYNHTVISSPVINKRYLIESYGRNEAVDFYVFGGLLNKTDDHPSGLTRFRLHSFALGKHSVSSEDYSVIDVIPVLDLDCRPCLYDKLNGGLYYNQGTGEFTWGELETV